MSDMTPSHLRLATGLPLTAMLVSIEPDATASAPRPEARRAGVSQARDLRATAHAAARAVQAGGTPAVEAALNVLDAELGELRAFHNRQQEALRVLALYAPDAWARAVAQRALDRHGAPIVDALPASLYDRELATASAQQELPGA